MSVEVRFIKNNNPDSFEVTLELHARLAEYSSHKPRKIIIVCKKFMEKVWAQRLAGFRIPITTFTPYTFKDFVGDPTARTLILVDSMFPDDLRRLAELVRVRKYSFGVFE